MINQASAIVKKHLGRLIAADTIAMVLHGLAGAVLVIITEYWIASIEFKMVLAVRLLYDAFVLIGAYFCGRLTDKIREVLQGTSGHPVRKFIAGGLSLSIFKIPIYVVSARVFDVSWEQVRLAASLYFVENMLTGWLYLIILDWARRRFAAKPANNNP